MIGGAVQGDHEEGLLGGLAGNAGERAHFRIAQFTAGHGGGDLGQALERMSDADPLAGSAQIQAAFRCPCEAPLTLVLCPVL